MDPESKQISPGLSVIASCNNPEIPVELLFGRKLRTNIHDIVSRPHEENKDVRDKDDENKAKLKWYNDEKGQAQYFNVTLGDTVLVKQDKQNKLTNNFDDSDSLLWKKGNSVAI